MRHRWQIAGGIQISRLPFGQLFLLMIKAPISVNGHGWQPDNVLYRFQWTQPPFSDEAGCGRRNKSKTQTGGGRQPQQFDTSLKFPRPAINYVLIRRQQQRNRPATTELN
jgi:hypothetical protein